MSVTRTSSKKQQRDSAQNEETVGRRVEHTALHRNHLACPAYIVWDAYLQVQTKENEEKKKKKNGKKQKSQCKRIRGHLAPKINVQQKTRPQLCVVILLHTNAVLCMYWQYCQYAVQIEIAK